MVPGLQSRFELHSSSDPYYLPTASYADPIKKAHRQGEPCSRRALRAGRLAELTPCPRHTTRSDIIGAFLCPAWRTADAAPTSQESTYSIRPPLIFRGCSIAFWPQRPVPSPAARRSQVAGRLPLLEAAKPSASWSPGLKVGMRGWMPSSFGLSVKPTSSSQSLFENYEGLALDTLVSLPPLAAAEGIDVEVVDLPMAARVERGEADFDRAWNQRPDQGREGEHGGD